MIAPVLSSLGFDYAKPVSLDLQPLSATDLLARFTEDHQELAVAHNQKIVFESSGTDALIMGAGSASFRFWLI